jgi:hypothetical protein
MARSLQPSQIDDFVEASLPKIVAQEKWNDISMDLQEYYFASRLFDKAEKEEMGGPSCRFELQVANPGNFKLTGLFATDDYNRVNILTHGSMAWSMNTVNYIYDIDEEQFQQGAVSILKYLKAHEHAMYNDYFAGMETLMFGDGPTSPTQEEPPPAGLLWWLQESDTEGFNGGEPSGFEAVGTGGILSSTYKNWKNRTYQYTTVSRDDFVEKTINSMDMCYFKPPAPYPSSVSTSKPRWELLTTHSRVAEARKLLQLGNDNIQNDLAAFSGGVLVRGVPMVHVPAWSSSVSTVARTDGVILGVDWSKFKYVAKSGRSMRKTAPYPMPGKKNVRVRAMDDAGQILCLDRRSSFRGHCSATVTETA